MLTREGTHQHQEARKRVDEEKVILKLHIGALEIILIESNTYYKLQQRRNNNRKTNTTKWSKIKKVF
ncbi:hypothetical protein WUBG_04423 [Wuchereria bancrofti]|uniref:Uncharacterized protein n=1 Tax=Wuchereria bancrofti TaxID=6293 RepID=J9ER54_WUCBA|nr:hypothetical protein WUBG_04423 [Wuchereria bancrofti]